MPSRTSFPRLIEALANSVIHAQQRISHHQINNVRQFFDSDNRPVSVDIRTPSLHPDSADDQEDIHRVPLITLVQSNQLSIKDFEITFDATLGDITTPASGKRSKGGLGSKLKGHSRDRDDEADEGDGTAWYANGPPEEMSVDPQPTKSGTKGPTARITMRVEGKEPPEGMARLVDRLVKTI